MATKSWDDMLDEMNGRAYTLDGIHGTIKVERTPSALHGGLPILKVTHEPSKRGQKSDAYAKTRRQLGDDWNTDLTWSERLADIAVTLGVA